jgi:hypothetical protein
MPTSNVDVLYVEARTFVDDAPDGLLTSSEIVEPVDRQTFRTIDSATGERICAVAYADIKTGWTDSR